MEGQPQIMRYRWGQPKAEVLVDSDRLTGYPRAFKWDGDRLLYSDDQGLKAVTLDDKQISKVAGPGVPVALPLRGGAFAPGSLRYVTVQDGKLVLAEAGATQTQPLADLPQAGMPPTRVAWAPGGDRVAVEVGSQPASSQILLLSTGGGPQRQFTGQNPVLFADRLYFLFPAQDFWQVMEVRLPDGEPTPVNIGRQTVLAGDPVHGRLFVFKGAGSQLTYLPVK